MKRIVKRLALWLCGMTGIKECDRSTCDDAVDNERLTDENLQLIDDLEGANSELQYMGDKLEEETDRAAALQHFGLRMLRAYQNSEALCAERYTMHFALLSTPRDG